MWFVLAFATCAFVGVTRGQEDCQNNLQLFCMLGKASGMMDCEKKSWHNNCMLSCGGCGDNTHAAYSMDHSTCSDHPLCEQSRKDGQLDCFKTSTKMYCPSSCGRCQHEAEQEHSHCTDHPMCGVKRPVDCSSPTHANYCPWSCGRCAHERHETDLAPAVCDVLVEHLGCGEFWVSEHCRTMCRVPTTGVLTTENRGHIEVTATNKQIIDGGDESSITAANQTTENGRSNITNENTLPPTNGPTTTTRASTGVTEINHVTGSSVGVVHNKTDGSQNDSAVDISSSSLPVCAKSDILDCDGTGCDSEFVANLCPKMCGLCH